MLKDTATVALLAGLSLGWGCSSPSQVEDPEQKLVVQAYLVPGQDTEVRMRHMLPPGRYYDGLEDTVRGARVQIAVDGATFVLSERADEPGTYAVPSRVMEVVSGGTYALTVTDGDRQARASTVVPFPVEITQVTADTIVYYQQYGDSYGELMHPGEFRWTRSPNAAGYVVIVESPEVRSLSEPALPLTADLDTLLAWRQRAAGMVGQDSLDALDRRIAALRAYFEANVSLLRPNGEEVRWLRDRDQEDWDKIDGKDWSEGKRWRERMDKLFFGRSIDFWVPADTLRSDYWWLGVRFEGEYRVTVQAADRNYMDYYQTSFNGQSGNDGDKGPVFHVENGFGVFGSYAADSFGLQSVRGDSATSLKVLARRE
ncbi:MAG: DUF4249 family protein [Candidatus Latescibacterota bacterium]